MKKKFIYLFSAIMFGTTITLNSCGGDDPSPGDPINTDKLKRNAVFTTYEGDKVVATQIGSYDLSYDATGLCTKIDEYVIDYDEGLIYDTDDYYDELKFALNSSGYISSITFNSEASYGQETGNAKFSYDGSGHITGISVEGKYKYYENGITYNDTYSGTVSLTWSNNKCTKVQYSDKDYYDDEGYTCNESGTLIIINEEVNTLGQYTYSFKELMDCVDVDEFALAGFLGKAPGYLPTEIQEIEKHTHSDGSANETDSYTYNYNYSFNNDGTISTEFIKEDGYSFSKYYRYRTLTESRSYEESLPEENFSNVNIEKRHSHIRILPRMGQRHYERKHNMSF